MRVASSNKFHAAASRLARLFNTILPLRLLKIGENLLTLGASGLDVANHVEGGLRKVICVALNDLLERPDRVLEVNQSSLDTSEDLGDGEWLREETLQLTGTLDGQLVLLGKFVESENASGVLVECLCR